MSDQKVFPRMSKVHTQIEAKKKSRQAQTLVMKWKECKTLI